MASSTKSEDAVSRFFKFQKFEFSNYDFQLLCQSYLWWVLLWWLCSRAFKELPSQLKSCFRAKEISLVHIFHIWEIDLLHFPHIVKWDDWFSQVRCKTAFQSLKASFSPNISFAISLKRLQENSLIPMFSDLQFYEFWHLKNRF